ncbi:hypothetical protein ACFELO_00745 [Oceanicaulis sp. LC35]|uniref:NAD(P)H-dependent amine dehydrogenase family protein n=1 Tax=Oceanicaulis sp. LC35 TaxID=3349635 RepID=UPI003F8268BE
MKVIQWATGAMGRTCLQAVIDSDVHELVGLFVYGDRKAGKDAGEIAKRDATGVIATRDIEEILALEADVVIHAARLAPPVERHDADILRLLRSGKNVISINGGTYPPYWPAERQERYRQAGEEGGATFVGAGLNPGFAVEKLGVIATGICRRVDRITISELVDCRPVRSPEYVFDIIGFGADVSTIDPNAPDWVPAQTMNALFEEVVAAMAVRLGWTLDRVETAHALVPAQSALEIAAGRIEPGKAARIDWRWIAHADGAPRVDLNIAWTMEPPAPDADAPGLWRINVEGEPGVNLTLELTEPEGWTERVSPEMLGVSGAVLNAIPLVVAAEPGLMETPGYAPWRAS